MLSQYHPSLAREICPCLSLNDIARELILILTGELAPALRRTGLTLTTGEGEPTLRAWTGQLIYHLDPQLGLRLANPNIYPI